MIGQSQAECAKFFTLMIFGKYISKKSHKNRNKETLNLLRFCSYGEINAKKKSEVHQANNDDNEAGRPGFGGTLGDLPRATCSLLQNGVYACIVLNNGFDAMIAVGLAAFFPKFLEVRISTCSYS